MKSAGARKDLVVLVADKNMDHAVRGLVGRSKALNIRELAFDTFVHVNRDHGCFQEAHTFLRAFADRYSHALVLLDREGCGRERLTRAEIELEIEGRLASNGWNARAATIVLDPELEVWVWSDSPEVEHVLGWSGKSPGLWETLRKAGFLEPGAVKPKDPKGAMEYTLRAANIPRSSSLYGQLAQRVGLNRCEDEALRKLRRQLQTWFPI